MAADTHDFRADEEPCAGMWSYKVTRSSSQKCLCQINIYTPAGIFTSWWARPSHQPWSLASRAPPLAAGWSHLRCCHHPSCLPRRSHPGSLRLSPSTLRRSRKRWRTKHVRARETKPSVHPVFYKSLSFASISAPLPCLTEANNK